MNKEDIKNTVVGIIEQIAKEQSIDIPNIEGYHAIVDDLGFSSLDVATLVSMLENVFKVDVFADGSLAITDIRTVKDICNVYSQIHIS